MLLAGRRCHQHRGAHRHGRGAVVVRRYSRGDGGARVADAADAAWSGPRVDWSRYHVQVLFVDRRDQVRAKIAAGLFSSISEWNGWGRAMLPFTAGVEVVETRSKWAGDLAAQAGIMAVAHAHAGLTYLTPFARQPEPFELRDLHIYDVVVAIDEATRESILQHCSRADPELLAFCRDKVRLLSEFACGGGPLSDADVLAKGGLALLPRSLSSSLQHDLAALRGVRDVPRPSLSDASEAAAAAWACCVRTSALGAAGLVKYLMDRAEEQDLPPYDPL